MYSGKMSPEMKSMFNEIYEDIHNDVFSYSFYMEAFQKQSKSIWKSFHGGTLDALTKEVINLSSKAFLLEKVKEGKLKPLYNIRCLSCRKKIYGPVNSLKNLPEFLSCQYCEYRVDTENDYLDYDLRYAFTDKPEPMILV